MLQPAEGSCNMRLVGQATSAQPVARMAITPDEWSAFRALAVRLELPVAVLLARIVRRELAAESEASQ